MLFCEKCGSKNQNGAKFCKRCGQPIGSVDFYETTETSEESSYYGGREDYEYDTKSSITRRKSAKKRATKKKNGIRSGILYFIGGILFFIISIIVFIIAYGKYITIDLNKYLIIEATGVNGQGTASIKVDWDAIEEKYGDRIHIRNEAIEEYGGFIMMMKPIDVVRDNVRVRFDENKNHNLSNGDEVSFQWSVDKDLKHYVSAIIKYSDDYYTVYGLNPSVGGIQNSSDVTNDQITSAKNVDGINDGSRDSAEIPNNDDDKSSANPTGVNTDDTYDELLDSIDQALSNMNYDYVGSKLAYEDPDTGALTGYPQSVVEYFTQYMSDNPDKRADFINSIKDKKKYSAINGSAVLVKLPLLQFTINMGYDGCVVSISGFSDTQMNSGQTAVVGPLLPCIYRIHAETEKGIQESNVECNLTEGNLKINIGTQ